jgi:thiamine kinase-like enzyme
MMDLFDLEAAEKAESQIDAFILKRSRERDDANRIEEAWKESTRRVNEKRLRENRDAWAAHYRQLALCHHDLAAENAARADAMLGEGAA